MKPFPTQIDVSHSLQDRNTIPQTTLFPEYESRHEIGLLLSRQHLPPKPTVYRGGWMAVLYSHDTVADDELIVFCSDIRTMGKFVTIKQKLAFNLILSSIS